MGCRVDIRQLKQLQKKMEAMQRNELDKLLEDISKEIARRLLNKVVKRTPVGVYPKGSGKVGGTLRRGWTGGKEIPVKTFVDGIRVNKLGSTYVIEIKNDVKYALFVEYGHRTRNGANWVNGKFMMTISEQEVQNGIADRVVKKHLEKKLREVFSGS